MIEVFKILHGYYDKINDISLFCIMLMLLQGVTNMNGIKLLLNMILESTFSLTEWCHYGIFFLMALWTDTINCLKS